MNVSALDDSSPTTASWFKAESASPTAAQVAVWKSMIPHNHSVIHDHEFATALLDLPFRSGYKGFTLVAPDHTTRRFRESDHR